MSARDWQPGDEALVRVKVEYALGSEVQLTLRGADADGSVIVPAADLVPVLRPDDDPPTVLALLDRVAELEAAVGRVRLAIDHGGMVHVAGVEDALAGDGDE